MSCVRIQKYNAKLMLRKTASSLLKRVLFPYSVGGSVLAPTTFQDDFEIMDTLGQGSTSRVFYALNIVNSQRVVLKLFKPIQQQKLARQVRILRMVRDCPNLIALRHVIRNQGTKTYALVFDDHPGITLNKIIKDISLKDIKKYIKDVLQTLECMHLQGVMHRDIKPSNILICGGQERTARLFDFGLAETIQPQRAYKFTVGTKCYKPPELLLRRTHYDESIDIWGVGVILAEMLYQIKPLYPYQPDDVLMLQNYMKIAGGVDQKWLNEDQKEVLGRVPRFQGIKRRPDLPSVDEAGRDMVHKLMAFTPSRRLTARQALKHPFLQE